VAPALVGRTLKLGNSDWALFNTIRNGVGSTSMPPHAWEERRIWQVITYLRSIGNTLSDTESGHSRVGDGTTLPSEIRVNVP